MSKRHSAKYKIDRRMGENLWGRPKSPVNQRSYGPGQHGQRRKSKVSDFGLQLRAKQKLKGYYAKFVPTPFAARQFVNHGHVLVNGKRVNIASYRVKAGDVVSVREKSRNMALVIEALASHERDFADYITVDVKGMSAKYIRIPELAEVPYPVKMEPNLVIEFYAS
jgi:small subunit ribosomal protein S4